MTGAKININSSKYFASPIEEIFPEQNFMIVKWLKYIYVTIKINTSIAKFNRI